MRRSEYKYLACAVALSLGVGLGGQTAFAAVDGSEAPAGFGVDLNTGKSDMINTPALTEGKGSIDLPDEESVDKEDVKEAVPTRNDVWEEAKPAEEDVIKSIEAVEGNTIVDVRYEGVSEDVMGTVKLAGDICSGGLLADDASSLYATGYFYDVYPTFETVPEGVIVTYHLFETPVISSIELNGNTDIEPTSKLLGRMQLHEGDRLNRLALKEDVRAIQKQYIKDGYIMAKIRDMEVGDDGKLVI